MGVLSREKHPLKQIHFKKGGWAYFQGWAYFREITVFRWFRLIVEQLQYLDKWLPTSLGSCTTYPGRMKELNLQYLFLLEHQSVTNSLQFFQWLVLLKCPGENYGSSGSKTIGFEATVWYKHTWTHLIWVITVNVSVVMATITTRGVNDADMGFHWHFMLPKHKPCTLDYHTQASHSLWWLVN